MNGQLSEQPLAELVSEIFRKGLSGALRLRHESVRTVVYFEGGQIVYAASNLRELRLAEYLKKQGLVSDKQLSSFGDKRSDLSLVSDLCAGGIIDRKTVEPLIERQVGDLLRVALLWTNGTWEFDDRSRLGDPVRIKLDTSTLLMQTARKMRLEFVRSRFLSPDELISPVTDLPDFHTLLPAESFVLSRLDRPLKLRELIALSALRELDAVRTIYGLALGGFLEREHRLNALAHVPAKPNIPEAKSDHLLSRMGPSEEEKLEDLNGFLARVEGASSYYEVLNVSTTGATEEIKACYYKLARNYHPDRFHLQASTPMHARIEAAFARITQGYETLTDSKRRLAYDAKLAAQEKARQFAQSAPKRDKESEPVLRNEEIGTLGKSDLERAENSYKEGFAALKQGQMKLAVTNLAAAARLAPQDPRYRAYYGRALAMEDRTRRLAEAELQAAVKLDSGNASYRVMLAELYYDLGLYRRAEGELERAISFDPDNPDARKLMRRLEAARTAK
jgi:curved DNA-binding protein CbpA